jgi:chromosomal replication initiation ATPase DnaA
LNTINFDISNQKSFPAICDDAFMKKLEMVQNSSINQNELTLEKIIHNVCEYYQIDELELHKKSCLHVHTKIRSIVAIMAIEFKVCSATKVAAYFNREHSTISRKLNTILFSSSYMELLRDIREFIKSANMQA